MLKEMEQAVVWQVEPDASAVRDVVLMARVDGYVQKLEALATLDAMKTYMSKCRALYVTAHEIDLLLGFETAMGNKWGVKRK